MITYVLSPTRESYLRENFTDNSRTECDLFLVMTNFGNFLDSVPRDRHLTDRFIRASRWKLNYIIIMPYFAEKVYQKVP